jgi:hypothetical protein
MKYIFIDNSTDLNGILFRIEKMKTKTFCVTSHLCRSAGDAQVDVAREGEHGSIIILSIHDNNQDNIADPETRDVEQKAEEKLLSSMSGKNGLVIRHSGGWSGVQWNKDSNELECSFNWLDVNIGGVIEYVMNSCSTEAEEEIDVKMIIRDFLNQKKSLSYFWNLDVLLQGYLELHKRADKQVGIVSRYPCRWFWECREDIEELARKKIVNKVKDHFKCTAKSTSITQALDDLALICNEILRCPAGAYDSNEDSKCPSTSLGLSDTTCEEICGSKRKLFGDIAKLHEIHQSYVNLCQLL